MSSTIADDLEKTLWAGVGILTLWGAAAIVLQDSPEVEAQKDLALTKVTEILESPDREGLLGKSTPYRDDDHTYSHEGQEYNPSVRAYGLHFKEMEDGSKQACAFIEAANDEGYNLFYVGKTHCIPEGSAENSKFSTSALDMQ